MPTYVRAVKVTLRRGLKLYLKRIWPYVKNFFTFFYTNEFVVIHWNMGEPPPYHWMLFEIIQYAINRVLLKRRAEKLEVASISIIFSKNLQLRKHGAFINRRSFDMTTAALMKTKGLLLRLAFVQSPLCLYLLKITDISIPQDYYC